MNTTIKLVLAATAVIVVAVAGISFLPSNESGVGSTATPSPSPSIPLGPPATVRIGGSPLTATVRVADGWSTDGGFVGVDTGGRDAATFHLGVVDHVFSDPCDKVRGDVTTESSVSDVATALSSIPDVTTSDPVQTKLAGYDATYIELPIPASLPCAPDEFWLWGDAPDSDWWPTETGRMFQFWIVDVGGRPVLIEARTNDGTTEARRAELDAALNSLVFEEA